MGWTAGHLEGPFTGRAAIKFALGQEFASRVIDAARCGTVIYAAVRSSGGDQVFGLVLLAERTRGTLYTKPISEDMGPAEDRCPERILRLLSEPSNDYAAEWRARCRARLQRGRPRPGQRVIFAAPVNFSDGSSHTELTFVRGSRFRADSGGELRIPNWAALEFGVLAPHASSTPGPQSGEGECIVCGHTTPDRSRSRGRSHWRCADGEECAVRRNRKRKRPHPEAEVRARWRRSQASPPAAPNPNPHLPSNQPGRPGAGP